ncbi:MAG: protoheme IX farnesyltransferase [bacterium]
MSHTATLGSTGRDLLALAKPSVTMLVVITTAGGLWLAPGSLSWAALFATLAGTVLVVAAANTLNCWWERESDKHMARTKGRPLPAGRMRPATALALGIGLSLVSVPLLTALVNPLTGMLAAIALFSYVLVYTPMKQHSPHAVIVGAIPGAMPPLMGWTAVTGQIDLAGLILFGVLFIWQIPTSSPSRCTASRSTRAPASTPCPAPTAPPSPAGTCWPGRWRWCP